MQGMLEETVVAEESMRRKGRGHGPEQPQQWSTCAERRSARNSRNSKNCRRRRVAEFARLSDPYSLQALHPETCGKLQRVRQAPEVVLDLRTGWSLNEPGGRAKCRTTLEERKPIVVIGSLPQLWKSSVNLLKPGDLERLETERFAFLCERVPLAV